jgi:hypothetical protein
LAISTVQAGHPGSDARVCAAKKMGWIASSSVLPALLALTFVAQHALASTGPTSADRKAIAASLRRAEGATARVRSINISHGYARVRFRDGHDGTWIDLFRLQNGSWRDVWGFKPPERSDGACAYAPSAVVFELLSAQCPSAAAVHARRATAAELRRLRVAFANESLTHLWARGGGSNLITVCVSQLNREWAAGEVRRPSTFGIVWFHFSTRWSATYETLGGRGRIPAPRIVLSLASCVGYNAAEYGG